uniref:2'-phosphotransferase n=1 Tax=Strigops habroptila TaxID=2489341 RepID=A0A672UN03_STRHB
MAEERGGARSSAGGGGRRWRRGGGEGEGTGGAGTAKTGGGGGQRRGKEMGGRGPRPPPPQDPSVRLSKALSYVLRHGAVAEGLPMGPDGFVPLGALLRLRRFAAVSERDVRRVVAADPKGRFELSPDPPRIRANQGHSLHVPELALVPLRTPEALPRTLAHGTRRRCWARIRAEGGGARGGPGLGVPGLHGGVGARERDLGGPKGGWRGSQRGFGGSQRGLGVVQGIGGSQRGSGGPKGTWGVQRGLGGLWVGL